MRKPITISDLKKHASQHVREQLERIEQQPKKTAALPKIPKVEAKQLTWMKDRLRIEGIEFVSEYVFSDRKFRFDIAIPEKMIAIEYEGIFSEKSRHTSIMGYSKDSEKYNLAANLGWRVFRYTAVTVKNFETDILILKNNNDTRN